MIFNIHNVFRTAAVAFLSACALVSCIEEESVRSDVGYLGFPGIDVDLTVEDLLDTRAIDGLEIPEPDLNAVEYEIIDAKGEVTTHTGPWTEPFVLPVGEYTIKAVAGSNSYGAPYYTGTVKGTIVALTENTPQLKMALSNSVVKVTIAPSLSEHFTPAEKVIVNDGAYEPAFGEWFFAPAGETLSIRFSGTPSVGGTKEFSYSFSTSAKVAYNVVCGNLENNPLPTISLPEQQTGAWATRLYIDPATVSGEISDANKALLKYEVVEADGDWTSAVVAEQISGEYHVVKGLANGASYKVRARIGNLFSEERTVTVMENLPGVTVKSEHYKDDGNNLAGTNSTLSVPELPGILGTLSSPEVGLLQITGYSLSNGTETVRTASAAGVMTPASGWPYLPQGSHYVLTIDHKLRDDSSSVASKNTGFISPSPKGLFAVSLTSYSSYDKYLENNKDAANAMDAFTIKTLGATWTVSPDLMGNSNYSKSFTYNNNGQSVSTYSGNTCTLGDKENLAVGTQYKVSASLTFDGESVSTAEKTHYITGMPYRQEPPVKGAWEEDAKNSSRITWDYNGGVNLRASYAWGKTYARITSNQEFRLPADINVNVITNGIRYGSMINVYYYVRFGTTELYKTSSTSGQVICDVNKTFPSGSYNVQMESSYASVNGTDSYNVNNVHVLYGSLPQ